MRTKVLFPVILILAGVSWLAFSNLSKANYFFEVNELPAMGDKVYEHGLKVKGRIVVGSIDQSTKPIKFTIAEQGTELRVHYVGEEPLPDLFKDRAEAVVEGSMRADGIFEARHLQAKCASKYEAEAPDASEGNAYPGYDKESKPEQPSI